MIASSYGNVKAIEKYPTALAVISPSIIANTIGDADIFSC
jgi:hypothetical protein